MTNTKDWASIEDAVIALRMCGAVDAENKGNCTECEKMLRDYIKLAEERVREEVREFIKSKKEYHERLHGSVDCVPCAFDMVHDFLARTPNE